MSDTAAHRPEMGQKLHEVINERDRQFAEGFNHGNPAAVAALYAEDATFLPANQEVVSGRAAIQQLVATFQDEVSDLALEPLDVRSEGDLGYEMGRYTQIFQPQGGQPVTETGTYLTVWKRQGGEWKIAYDTGPIRSQPLPR